MSARRLATLAALALAAAPLAGCVALFGDDEEPAAIDAQQQVAEDILGDEGLEAISAAASRPSNYTFPGQLTLPLARLYVNGTIGTEANLALEGNRDQGGIDYNSVVQTTDISSYVPVGQPVEILAKLYWNAKELNSMDIDIVVDVPGTKTSHYAAKTEDVNWNFATKTMTINTVGVAGANHLIGVQANSGKTTGPLDYSLLLEFNYPQDVIGPAVPYAIQVPANASGLVFESVKTAGDESITSEFIVIGPEDDLVGYVEYNDLAIPTESVFVPTKGPGEYVVYAFYLSGGFLSVRADVPLDTLAARPLALVETATTIDAAPAPGLIARDWAYGSALEGTAPTMPMTGQKQATFNVDGAHPLLVYGWFKGSGTVMSQMKISSPAGVVNEITRALRYDDERGSLGYTSDEGYDNTLTYANVAKGGYTIDYVNDGPLELGVTVVTYQR